MDFCTNDLFEVTNNVAKRQIVATQDIRACDMHCILQGIGADDSSSSLSDVWRSMSVTSFNNDIVMLTTPKYTA